MAAEKDAFTEGTTETKLTLPFNGTIYTTRRRVSAETRAPLNGETAAGQLGPAWADSRIVSSSLTPARGASASQKDLQFVHARIPSEADQLATNWEYSTCSIGGQEYPSVARTVVLLASAVARDAPAIGSAMPFVPGDLFDGAGYILADRQLGRSGMDLEPVFRVERRNYVKRSTMRKIGVDPLNGKTLWGRSDLVHASEVLSGGLTAATLFETPGNAYWGLQADGTQVTGRQLSCSWYSVETEQVVSGAYALGVVDLGTFTSNDDYYWPPVLQTFELMDWVRLDGGVDIYPRVTFNPDGYRGPCATSITRTWSKSPFTIPVVNQMMPTRMYYSCPYYTANISECLHPAVTFQCDIGNSDPIYDMNVGSSRTFAATNYTSWPATIVAFDDQEPFRGGYLRTRRVVSKPSV